MGKKRNGGQAGRLDSAGSLSSADNASSTTQGRSDSASDIREVISNCSSREPSSAGRTRIIEAEDEEFAAQSIASADDGVAILHRWTAGVRSKLGEPSGSKLQADNGQRIKYLEPLRQMLLKSPALEICLERCAELQGLVAIERPLVGLLKVLGAQMDAVQLGEVCEISKTVLKMAGEFPTSNYEAGILHPMVAAIKDEIANHQLRPDEVHASVMQYHQRCTEQEKAMDMKSSISELSKNATGFVSLVSSRVALARTPNSEYLGGINALEAQLNKELTDSKKDKEARTADLQQESLTLAGEIWKLEQQEDDFRRLLAEVQAALAQARARQEVVTGTLAGNVMGPPPEQMEQRLKALRQLKKAVQRVLPGEEAGALQLPGRAAGAAGPEGLAAADFIKHCLTVHNKLVQQLHQRGRALATTMKMRRDELKVCHEVGNTGPLLELVQKDLAAAEKEMEELVAKASLLQRTSDEVMALAKAQRSVAAPIYVMAELERLQADTRAACHDIIVGPEPQDFTPPVEAPKENGEKKKKQAPRKPRVQDANGTEKAAPRRPARAPRDRDMSPEYSNGRGRKRDEEMTPEEKLAQERAKQRAAKEKALAELSSKGRKPSSKPAAPAAKPVANGAAYAKTVQAAAAPSGNPWRKDVLNGPEAGSPEQLPNGQASPTAAPEAPAAADIVVQIGDVAKFPPLR